MNSPYISPKVLVTQKLNPSLLEIIQRNVYQGINDALTPIVGTNASRAVIDNVIDNVKVTLKSILPGMEVECAYQSATGTLRTRIDVSFVVDTAIVGPAAHAANAWHDTPYYALTPAVDTTYAPAILSERDLSDTNDGLM